MTFEASKTSEPFDQRLWDATVRIDNMWPIPGCEPSEQMREEVDTHGKLPEVLMALVARWSEDERDELIGGDRDAWEEFFAVMSRANVRGFLTQVSAPVFRAMSADSASFSWGNTHWALVFGETAEDAISAGIALAETWREQDYAPARKGEPA